MSLDDIFMPPLPRRAPARLVMGLGEYPVVIARTPAQIAALRAMRLKQIGQTKAPNRIK